ncbi:hypothetical protein [Legionella waltersii]|uniref:Uncharacterized protein n=1 Tax=Legionella waltersii TaxID=66969 RepID=A0A0W1A1T6_9GAMM|nr:hypothetical protein [Legionella waltersii]KTD74979.1 hypothetical protein Lwal_3020 [Legionella waltersii]SNV08350.1 Uncharacterised protein [Legionella waltersii]
MVKIVIEKDNHEVVLLDTEHIRLGDVSDYYTKLSHYGKFDDAIDAMSKIDLNDEDNWRVAILLKNLQKKRDEAAEPEFSLLVKKCKEFIELSNSNTIKSMKRLSCYRVGVDAGAGFKEDDLDILGTEGFVDCVGLLIATHDQHATPCYYVAHINGNRTTKLEVQKELDKILSDVQHLTGRKLTWSTLRNQVTLVGAGSDTEEPSLCYKQTFKRLTQEKANPTPLFGSSVVFNLGAKSLDDLIVLDPKGQLNQGIQSKVPRAGHGVYSPLDTTIESLTSLTIEKQIEEAMVVEEREAQSNPRSIPFSHIA